jgi:hypothetical protein
VVLKEELKLEEKSGWLINLVLEEDADGGVDSLKNLTMIKSSCPHGRVPCKRKRGRPRKYDHFTSDLEACVAAKHLMKTRLNDLNDCISTKDLILSYFKTEYKADIRKEVEKFNDIKFTFKESRDYVFIKNNILYI